MPSNDMNLHSCSQEMLLIAPKQIVRGHRFFMSDFFFSQLGINYNVFTFMADPSKKGLV